LHSKKGKKVKNMLLVFDIGNTNMGLGVFKGKKLLKNWRINTDKEKTSDEYGILISSLFERDGLDINSVQDIIISSVVPNVMHSLENFCYKYCKKKPLIVGPGVKTGLNIKYDNPKQVGADRIVNAVAGIEKYVLNHPDIKVIATGGLANLIASETDSIDYVDSLLTLEGLRIIYEKNKE